MESIRNQDCLISTLMRLRESSKDAVVSADYVDERAAFFNCFSNSSCMLIDLCRKNLRNN